MVIVWFQFVHVRCPEIVAIIVSMSTLGAQALRIFLANALHEAEYFVGDYESQGEAWRCWRPSGGDLIMRTSSWDQVVSAARRLVSYIRKCLCHDGSVYVLSYGLSAIGAAQEALVSALVSRQSRTDNDHYIQLYTEHTLRAKFIVNSLIATSAQDHELASLWEQAAEEMHKRSQLKHIGYGNANDKRNSKHIVELTQQLLCEAVLLSTSECVDVKTEVAELQQLASRQYRLAAVCTVLERNCMHLYAAKAYQCAASLGRDSANEATPMTLKLWQTAVATMRLAGDMVIQHPDEISAKNDPLIKQNVDTANQLAADARRVPTLVAVLEEWKGKVDASRAAVQECKNPFLTPVLQLLLEKHERVHYGSEKYLEAVLQSESSTVVVSNLQQEFTQNQTEAADLQLIVEPLIVLYRNTQLYRKRAANASEIPYKEVKVLLYECWTKAADQADYILQLSADLAQEGIVQTLAHYLNGVWQQRNDILRSYVHTAENVLGCAVEYLNKARGAEAGEKNGRDPREAQMWRKAAEYRVSEADLICSTLSDDETLSMTREDLAIQLEFYAQEYEQAKEYSRAADYLSRSYQYRQLLNVEVHAQRVSDLYEKLAAVTIHRNGLNGLDAETTSFEMSVFGFAFETINLMTTCTTITPEQMRLYEMGCEYGFKCIQSTFDTGDSDTLWKDAFESSVRARNRMTNHFFIDATRHLAVASVFALGAAAADQGRNYFGLACARAARVINKYLKVGSFKMYHFVLAERIIVLADSTDPHGSSSTEPLVLPTEFRQLLHCEVNEDPAYQGMLKEHADAHCLEVECEYQNSVSCADYYVSRWDEAKDAVSDWICNLDLQAERYHDVVQPTSDDTSLLAFHKLSVSCYIAAARNTGNSALSAAWKAAVDMCKHVTIGHIDTATTAIERIVRAARAVESGDEELGALWRKAGTTARIVHERTISRSASIEAAYCEFRLAECNALAFVAQREERKRVSALWKKAALKWKEAVPLCPLTFVDTQQHKVKVKMEPLQKLKVEAEKLEMAAEAVAQISEPEQDKVEGDEDEATLPPSAASTNVGQNEYK